MTNSAELFEDNRRAKLINAIVYFTKNTKHCYKLKLLKLLYFFDFEHYRQTGKSVTGLKYQAWPMGPVASELYSEMESPSADLSSSVSFDNKKFPNGVEYMEIKAKRKFDDTLFSRRELKILETVADFFKDLNSEGMTTYSHDSKLPWKKVYAKGEGNGKEIDYDLVLDSDPLIFDKNTISQEELEYLRNINEGF